MLHENKIFAYGKRRARLFFISRRTVKLYKTQRTVKSVFDWSHVGCVRSGPDVPIGYVGLSQGPQDPRDSPANCIGGSRIFFRGGLKDEFIRM